MEEDEEESTDLECVRCGKEFKAEDTLYECEECQDIFCEDCQETHACIELVEEDNQACLDCGNVEEVMYRCPNCSDYFCDNCKENHEAEETKKKEYSVETYAAEKISEKLKDD
jgi:hypothetical protein